MVRIVGQKADSLFPVLSEKERGEIEQYLVHHNLQRLRLAAYAAAVFFLALIPLDYSVLAGSGDRAFLSLFPWLLGGRIFIVAGSLAFILFSLPIPSPGKLRPVHMVAELAYLLAVSSLVSVFNGLFLVFRESLSPFIMVVFATVALVRLDTKKNVLVFGVNGIVMLIMILTRAEGFGRSAALCTNVVIFSALALITAQVLYAKEVKDFLAQRLIGKQKAELETMNARLRRLCTMDDLTEVPNRRLFNQSLIKEWRRAARDGKFLAFIMVDLDYFKNLNDTLGHRMGDDCLKTVARVLGHTLFREGDMVARYGGEEFAVILPDTDLAGAVMVAEKMRGSVELLNLSNPGTPVGKVTISLGVACAFPSSGTGVEAVIMAADEALYRAKRLGRNRVEISGKTEAEDRSSERSAFAADA